MSKKRVKKTTRKTPAKKIKKPKEPKVGTYLGVDYESFCELSLLFFVEELIKAGYAIKVERSPSYLLCDPVQNTYAVQMKKSSKQETQTISQGVSYTPDFDIYFTKNALGVFCWELGSPAKWEKNLLVAQRDDIVKGDYIQPVWKACVEVKPDFSRNSTTPKSVQSMKWLFQKRGVFVNLFRPNRMFEGLFVPAKYLITERGTKRILKFKTKTLQEYLKGRK